MPEANTQSNGSAEPVAANDMGAEVIPLIRQASINLLNLPDNIPDDLGLLKRFQKPLHEFWNGDFAQLRLLKLAPGPALQTLETFWKGKHAQPNLPINVLPYIMQHWPEDWDGTVYALGDRLCLTTIRRSLGHCVIGVRRGLCVESRLYYYKNLIPKDCYAVVFKEV